MMNDLDRLILERVKQRFHPYIPQGEGWKRYPPHLARLLEYIEPLHIIVLTPDWVGVDGVFMDETRGMHEKFEDSVETVEEIFGETVEKAEYGNVQLRRLSTGLYSIGYFLGSFWFLTVCTKARPYPSRFAFISDQLNPCAPSRYTGEEKRIACVATTVDGAKVQFFVSREFFRDPRPENVRLFGDLLFLAQADNGWVVDREIDVEYACDYRTDGVAYLAHILEECPGLEAFIKHTYAELLLRDGDSGWRAIAKALKGGAHGRFERARGVC